MNKHDCLDQGESRRRLAKCLNHPRWHVWRDSFDALWVASPPMAGSELLEGAQMFTEHPLAVAYATDQARGEALAAVQSAEGVTAR